MASKQIATTQQQCSKYKYVVTPTGPKILPVPEPSSKDEESPAEYNSGGYLPIKVKDTFKDGRYHVLRKLGWGHFSTVWLVKDTRENRHSALKVVKSAGRYAETARDEIKLLRRVAAGPTSHPGREHVVAFFDAFQHVGPTDTHVCIVCEPLGENLLSLLERNKKKGVPINLVKVIAKQVLLGLQYLHDECDLVHTDIKPENIMISIPDVESHIQAELSMSPSPTSRRVGVPLPTKTRSGVRIARPANQARDGHLARQVEIFDSQPLSSPSTSAGSSPHVRRGLQMSSLSQSHTAGTSTAKANSHSAPSSVSTTPASIESVLVSASVAASSTPPTSLGSEMSKLALSSTSPESVRPTSGSEASVSPVESATAIQPHCSEALAKPSGPSLLSQTAPSREHQLESDTLAAPTPSVATSTTITPVGTTAPTPVPACEPTPEETLPLPPIPPISVKIADLGNATPTKKHYTEDIQTRQYRSPEAIVGRSDWGPNADIWSLACVIFELLTAEFLFDPQGQGELFTKDDDHMAQIIELLGDFELEAKMHGRYSREIFDSTGSLRYIKTLKVWPLDRVMVEKYLFKEEDAQAFCAFMLPMLQPNHKKRAQARDMIDHPWLDVSNVTFDEPW